MKLFAVCAVLVCGFTLLALFGHFFTSSLIDETREYLESALESAGNGDYDSAAAELEKSAQSWIGKRTTLSVLTNHNIAAKIVESLKMAEEYAKTQNDALLFGRVAAVQMMLDELSHSDIPNIENIF